MVVLGAGGREAPVVAVELPLLFADPDLPAAAFYLVGNGASVGAGVGTDAGGAVLIAGAVHWAQPGGAPIDIDAVCALTLWCAAR